MVDNSDHYDGPTTAELFVDDLATRRALIRHLGSALPTFEIGPINARYCVGAQASNNEDGMIARIVFLDGSAAKRNRRNRWIVN